MQSPPNANILNTMQTMQKKIIALALLLLLAACAEMPSRAPIDDRTAARNATKSKDQKDQKDRSTAEPLAPDAPGFYTVKKGDTLRKIAQQFSQSVRDITDWNNLSNPNDIKLGRYCALCLLKERKSPPCRWILGSSPSR